MMRTPPAAGVRGYAIGDTPGLLAKVFSWLTLSLLLTTGGVFLAENTDLSLPLLPGIIVIFGGIFAMNWAVRRRQVGLAVTLFSVFCVAEGLFIAPVLQTYAQVDPNLVGNAFLATVAIFGACAAIVWSTNYSFAAWGRWLVGALIAGIVLLVLSFFLPLSTVAISLFLGAVFVGLTLFDFWRVRNRATYDPTGLMLALSLYLDFLNLFLILLRIFGGGSRR